MRIQDILKSLALAAALSGAGTAGAAPAVVADIAPVHAIAARVMEGAGTPALLLPPGVSPHSYSLRPSQARLLDRAGVVVWTGPELTPWLADVLAGLAPEAVLVALSGAPGLDLLPVREAEEPGGHDEHEPDGHDEHEPDGHDEQEHGEHGHEDLPFDPHFWLDPRNGSVMADAIATALAGADPQNAALYQRNAEAFRAEMDRLEARIDSILDPVRDRPFVVYHDSLQYFEHRFGLTRGNSIASHEGQMPGAARVARIRDQIREEGIACVFHEPQMPGRLVETVIEGSEARASVLDPVGADIEPGPGFQAALLEAIARALADCLDTD